MEYISNSSNIEAINYLQLNRLLRINFKNGSVYEWTGVPKRKYEELLEAESKGKYFSAQIKGKYPSVKIKDSEAKYENVKDFFNI